MTNPPDISLPGTSSDRRATGPNGGATCRAPVTPGPLATAGPAEPAPPAPEPVAVEPEPEAVEMEPEPEPEPEPVAVEPEPPVVAAPPAVPADRRPELPRGRDLATAQLRRLVVLAVTVVLLGAGAGLLGASLWPPTYAARAEILYPVGPDEPTDNGHANRNLTTQLMLLRGRAVLAPVAQALGRAVEGDLEDDVTVQVLGASELIRVEARGPSREVAMTTLRAIVDRYSALSTFTRSVEVREYLHGELADVQSALADVRGRLRQLQGEVAAGIGSPAAIIAADNELQALLAREQDIRSQLDDLAVGKAAGPAARLLAPAYPVPDPVSPRPLLAAGAGALVGVAVAAVAVAAAARLRSRTGGPDRGQQK